MAWAIIGLIAFLFSAALRDRENRTWPLMGAVICVLIIWVAL